MASNQTKIIDLFDYNSANHGTGLDTGHRLLGWLNNEQVFDIALHENMESVYIGRHAPALKSISIAQSDENKISSKLLMVSMKDNTMSLGPFAVAVKKDGSPNEWPIWTLNGGKLDGRITKLITVKPGEDLRIQAEITPELCFTLTVDWEKPEAASETQAFEQGPQTQVYEEEPATPTDEDAEAIAAELKRKADRLADKPARDARKADKKARKAEEAGKDQENAEMELREAEDDAEEAAAKLKRKADRLADKPARDARKADKKAEEKKAAEAEEAEEKKKAAEAEETEEKKKAAKKAEEKKKAKEAKEVTKCRKNLRQQASSSSEEEVEDDVEDKEERQEKEEKDKDDMEIDEPLLFDTIFADITTQGIGYRNKVLPKDNDLNPKGYTTEMSVFYALNNKVKKVIQKHVANLNKYQAAPSKAKNKIMSDLQAAFVENKLMTDNMRNAVRTFKTQHDAPFKRARKAASKLKKIAKKAAEKAA
jgi:hypothetical protein